MKCKRCRAHVPDDADTCPLCGQDLSALRQLLRDFYQEEPASVEDQSSPPAELKASPKVDWEKKPVATEGPRLIFDTDRSGHSLDFSLPDNLPGEESLADAERDSDRETVSKGGFWIRSMAFAIDHLILLFILTIFVAAGFLALGMGTAAGGKEISFLKQARLIAPSVFPLACVLSLVYFSFFHGAWGQTIGKMIFGLRVIRIDGQPFTFSRSVARTLAYFLSSVPIFIGFFWVGFSSKKRGWHDILAGTMVIR